MIAAPFWDQGNRFLGLLNDILDFLEWDPEGSNWIPRGCDLRELAGDIAEVAGHWPSIANNWAWLPSSSAMCARR